MAKNIMICCDGTDNEYGENNTNVVKIFELAVKDDARQICYYDPGVGTGGWERACARFIPIRLIFSKMSGKGLQKNVNDAYKYLMRSYKDGDKIYLFGFSRGAFTARSLAGMLHKCGLLKPRLDNMLEYAAKMYNTPDNDEIAAKFKETFSHPCPVHFVGVWDTVASLIMTAGRKFHDATLNSEVGFGCHAVSLDEVRGSFPPSLWDNKHPNIEQVWFDGVHSDVGGSYNEAGLSDIALKWMAKKAKDHGLLLDEKALENIQDEPLAAQHNSYTFWWWLLMRHIRKLEPGAKIHSSVRDRLGQKVQIMDDKSNITGETEYRPCAEMKDGSPFSQEKVEFVD